MTVYAVALIKVHDREAYRPYEENVLPILAKFNAKVIAFDEEPTIVEGDWPYTRSLIMSFQSPEDLNNWYNSPEYQALVRHRHAASTGQIAALRSFE